MIFVIMFIFHAWAREDSFGCTLEQMRVSLLPERDGVKQPVV